MTKVSVINIIRWVDDAVRIIVTFAYVNSAHNFKVHYFMLELKLPLLLQYSLGRSIFLSKRSRVFRVAVFTTDRQISPT